MSNCNEILKKAKVPKAMLFYNPDKAKQDNNRHAKDAADFGNDDYKAIIERNMKGSGYGDKGRTDEHKEV